MIDGVQVVAQQEGHNLAACPMRGRIEISACRAIEAANAAMMVDEGEPGAMLQFNVALDHEFGRVSVIPVPHAVALPQRPSI
jgi:hypothetical protein